MTLVDTVVAGRIVALVSYPKSGNTWLRALLTAYRDGANEPPNINRLDGAFIASSRSLFDDETGVSASELTREEIARYRSRVYTAVSNAATEAMLMKVHDAFTRGPDGPLFSASALARAVYIVRNPLDVAVSLASHSSISIDEAISRVCEGHRFASTGHRLHEQLEQELLSWSAHVTSWVDQREIPVHVVRYEDLRLNPEGEFSQVLSAVGLSPAADVVARAVALCAFDRLRAQEEQAGFQERPPHSDRFFRSGRAGGWRDVLTATQVGRIVACHRETMTRFGYLDHSGIPR
jgi:hypothetical protein